MEDDEWRLLSYRDRCDVKWQMWFMEDDKWSQCSYNDWRDVKWHKAKKHLYTPVGFHWTTRPLCLLSALVPSIICNEYNYQAVEIRQASDTSRRYTKRLEIVPTNCLSHGRYKSEVRSILYKKHLISLNKWSQYGSDYRGNQVNNIYAIIAMVNTVNEISMLQIGNEIRVYIIGIERFQRGTITHLLGKGSFRVRLENGENRDFDLRVVCWYFSNGEWTGEGEGPLPVVNGITQE